MKDEKEPLEQKQNSEEEEYSFLQEIIKDEAGDQALSLIHISGRRK